MTKKTQQLIKQYNKTRHPINRIVYIRFNLDGSGVALSNDEFDDLLFGFNSAKHLNDMLHNRSRNI